MIRNTQSVARPGPISSTSVVRMLLRFRSLGNTFPYGGKDGWSAYAGQRLIQGPTQGSR